MAALPTTGLTTSAVASAIGEASNDVGALFLSDKVNEWGFNCPETNLQNAIWGKPSSERAKLSPSDANFTPIPNVRPGYHLGAFRAYDHNWVTYGLEGLGMTPTYFDTSGSYVGAMKFRLDLELAASKLSSKPTPNPAIDHKFKIEFARNSGAFDAGTATLVNDNFIVNYPSGNFTLQSKYPPDYAANGALDDNETFYIKITHLSSPDRRWYDLQSSVVYSFATPANPFTNTYYLQNLNAIAVKQLSPVYNYFVVLADLYTDYETARLMNFKAQMSNTSDFSANVYDVFINNYEVPMNTTNPGTRVFNGQLNFNFSGSGIHTNVVKGSTVYWRIYVNSVLYNGGSTVVTDQMPT